MAVVITNLDLDTGGAPTIHNDPGGDTTIVVPVPAFTSGAALLFSIEAEGSSIAAPSGASGLSGTMVPIIDALWVSGKRGISFAYEGASNAGGNVTITFPGNLDAGTVACEQVTGAAAASTWGGAGREGSNNGTGSGVGRPLLELTGALSTPAAGSVTYLMGIITDTGAASTQEAGYTLLADGTRGSFSIRLATAYHPSGDTTPTITMGQNASPDPWYMHAFEIPVAASTVDRSRLTLLGIG